MTYFDGSADPDEPDVQVAFEGTTDDFTSLAATEAFALALLDVIGEVRSVFEGYCPPDRTAPGRVSAGGVLSVWLGNLVVPLP